MKSKKSIIILVVVVLIGIIGFTFAYFSKTESIENKFKTKKYGAIVTEEFVSPNNWAPGMTTDKTLVVTNTGEVDEAVRISYTEEWVSQNGEILPLSQNGNNAAIINWANEDDWTTIVEDGITYKYYNYKLIPADVTTTILDSVTFNPNIINSSDCHVKSDGHSMSCTSTESGYDGATYTLTFKIETVQYNKYKDAWDTNLEILEEKL